MGSREVCCFSAKRICHHDDYFLLIDKFRPSVNIKDNKEKKRLLKSDLPIVFFDIDSADLKYFLLIMLRGLWGGKGLAISVRTEYLLEKRSIFQFIFHRRRLIYIKSLVKRFLFYFIKNFSTTTVLSIHNCHADKKRMEPFINDFVHDPQLWDIDILEIKPCRPPELKGYSKNKFEPIVLVAGRFDEQRSKNELLDYLQRNRQIKFIIAGIIMPDDFEKLQTLENCFLINRFLSNKELFFLYGFCSVIYCFYNNDRPSGFFGRALQFQKIIIVRKDKFLHNSFSSYNKLLPVKNLDELNDVNFKDLMLLNVKNNEFNSSNLLKDYIDKL